MQKLVALKMLFHKIYNINYTNYCNKYMDSKLNIIFICRSCSQILKHLTNNNIMRQSLIKYKLIQLKRYACRYEKQ